MQSGSNSTNQRNADDHLQQESNGKPVQTASANTATEAAVTITKQLNAIQPNANDTSSPSPTKSKTSSNGGNTKTDNETGNAINADNNDSMINATLTLQNNDNE